LALPSNALPGIQARNVAAGVSLATIAVKSFGAVALATFANASILAVDTQAWVSDLTAVSSKACTAGTFLARSTMFADSSEI
jgi:hypothetical protein